MNDTPVTTRAFGSPFSLYEVVKLPLPTPETHQFYCMLSTDITAVAFARDVDHIIQLTDTPAPSGEIWTTRVSSNDC